MVTTVESPRSPDDPLSKYQNPGEMRNFQGIPPVAASFIPPSPCSFAPPERLTVPPIVVSRTYGKETSQRNRGKQALAKTDCGGRGLHRARVHDRGRHLHGSCTGGSRGRGRAAFRPGDCGCRRILQCRFLCTARPPLPCVRRHLRVREGTVGRVLGLGCGLGVVVGKLASCSSSTPPSSSRRSSSSGLPRSQSPAPPW